MKIKCIISKQKNENQKKKKSIYSQHYQASA